MIKNFSFYWRFFFLLLIPVISCRTEHDVIEQSGKRETYSIVHNSNNLLDKNTVLLQLINNFKQGSKLSKSNTLLDNYDIFQNQVTYVENNDENRESYSFYIKEKNEPIDKFNVKNLVFSKLKNETVYSVHIVSYYLPDGIYSNSSNIQIENFEYLYSENGLPTKNINGRGAGCNAEIIEIKHECYTGTHSGSGEAGSCTGGTKPYSTYVVLFNGCGGSGGGGLGDPGNPGNPGNPNPPGGGDASGGGRGQPVDTGISLPPSCQTNDCDDLIIANEINNMLDGSPLSHFELLWLLNNELAAQEIYNSLYQNNTQANKEYNNVRINLLTNGSDITFVEFNNWFVNDYSAKYKSNVKKLSKEEIFSFVTINKDLATSPYEEEYVKETNEAFIAFTAYADVENMTDAQMQYVFNNNCCAGLFIQQFAQEKAKMIVSNYQFNRKFYPEWSKSKCFWEASRETIQLTLDLGGMVPVIGEVCDLTNAAIYYSIGDNLNGSLSVVSAVPVVGWLSASTKLGVKVVNAASDVASRQILKWVVGNNGVIYFGTNTITQGRNQLRKVLKLTDATKHAHHIIPVEFAQNAIVQKAAKSSSAFHINEALNGIPLKTSAHLTGHVAYNTKIGQVLTVLNQGSPSPTEAYNKLMGFNNYLKILIINNPNLNLGQISNLINYP